MGGLGRRNRAALLATNLPQLQNLIKRDPPSYKQEFLLQYNHFLSFLSLLALEPTQPPKNFGETCTFISHVCNCYPQETKEFPDKLLTLFKNAALGMDSDMRQVLVKCLILLRNKDVISSQSLLELFFWMLQCHDKALRSMLYKHLIADLTNLNRKHKNNKLNKVLQNYIYKVLEEAENNSEKGLAARQAIGICCELFRKQVWNDEKTANIIAEACFSSVTTVSTTAVRFLLNVAVNDGKSASDDDDDDAPPDLRKLQHAENVSGKSKSRQRKMERATQKIKKKQKENENKTGSFLAIHLLNNPQGFIEKLYQKTNQGNISFGVRLLRIKLLGLVMGLHQLHLSAFFPYVTRYIQPHQENVTGILATIAQATHGLTPPDEVETVVKVIANRFVVETVANEVIIAGLNSIREICARQPLGMDATLLQDLTEYKSHREKGVMMAARGLISLYREVNPALLKKKDLGKGASQSVKTFQPLNFGEVRAASRIEGAELLQKAKGASKEEGREEEEGWSDWELESIDEGHEASDDDDEEEEGEWESVSGNSDIEKEEEPLETMRLLTDEDFAKLKELKQRKAATKKGSLNKKTESSDDESDQGNGEILPEAKITQYTKKRKAEYQERIESIKEGREGREKYGSSKGKKTRTSSTNKEKAKKKTFMMLKPTLKKGKPSLVARQKQLRRKK